MSGSIGANRILHQQVKPTVDHYLEKVLKPYKNFRKAVITGSYNTGTKKDYGDIDLILYLSNENGTKTDREVKQEFKDYLLSLPEDTLETFKGGRYKGRKVSGTGDIVIISYPVVGTDDKSQTVQVDNVIVVSEEDLYYRENFSNLPGEKQALLMGLAKVVLDEIDVSVRKSLFKELKIDSTYKLKEDQELEFTLSPKGLLLRAVTLDSSKKELGRDQLWESKKWTDVNKVLGTICNVNKSFQEIVDEIRNTLSTRSKRRIQGMFNNVLIIGKGEEGTVKGITKEKAKQYVNQMLEEGTNRGERVLLYPGGFKPPHKAHFDNIKYLLGKEKIDQIIIFIGPKVREGIPITAEQSKLIWQIYSKYLDIPVTIEISPIAPIRSVYEWVEEHQHHYRKISIGTGEEPGEKQKRYKVFLENPEKYSNVFVRDLPLIPDDNGVKVSGSEIRFSKEILEGVGWVPDELSAKDRKLVKRVVTVSLKEMEFTEEINRVVNQAVHTLGKTIKEGSSGTAIAPQSSIRSEDRSRLEQLYYKLKPIVGEEFFIEFNQNHIRIEPTYEGQKVGFDYTPYMASILEYMIKSGVNVEPLPEIVVKRDLVEAENPIGKTGVYTPETKTITLYVEGRYPKDVLRSFAHEIIHHKQNLEGRLSEVKSTSVHEDPELLKLEEEVYLESNRLFRQWEDQQKVQ